MPNIRPSSDVRNNYKEISKLCKETGAPVYITVNGKGDTAIIDINVLDELYARLDLYAKLAESENAIKNGEFKPAEEVFAKYNSQE